MAAVLLATFGLMAAFLAGLLVSEWKGSHLGVYLTKVPASTCFVAAALVGGALDSSYGKMVLAALVLSWLGDLLLIPERKDTFLGGLVSFLLAHIGYAMAFIMAGVAAWAAGFSLLLLVPFALIVARWLLPNVDKPMQAPVVVYMVAITAMVALAAGATAAGAQWYLLAGATMFFISDLAVARDRFVHPGFSNRAWGLPLYYGAQAALALTV